MDRNWLIYIKGGSIGWAPAHVNRIKLLIKIQYIICDGG